MSHVTNISITIGGESPKVIAANLRHLAAVLDPVAAQAPSAETPAEVAEAPAPKAAKKSKKTSAPKVEDEFDLGDGLSSDDAAESPEEEEDEEEEAAPTLESVLSAFRSYAQKTSRDKAGAVLEKLGVKSVRDLKEAQYAKALKFIA